MEGRASGGMRRRCICAVKAPVQEGKSGVLIRQRLYCPIDNDARLFYVTKPKTPKPEFPTAFRRLQAQIGKTGWIALGSLIERGQPGQGGPRYQWSRRVGHKPSLWL